MERLQRLREKRKRLLCRGDRNALRVFEALVDEHTSAPNSPSNAPNASGGLQDIRLSLRDGTSAVAPPN